MKKVFILFLISFITFLVSEICKYLVSFKFMYVSIVFAFIALALGIALFFTKKKGRIILSALSLALCIACIVPNFMILFKTEEISATRIIHAGGGFKGLMII